VIVVGARGFEPLTSSVSGKRSPPELSALCLEPGIDQMLQPSRRGPESNRCARLCRPLPNHSATPPRCALLYRVAHERPPPKTIEQITAEVMAKYPLHRPPSAGIRAATYDRLRRPLGRPSGR
jgi:hypothetical protein